MEAVYEHLLPRNWDSAVQAWLDEDIPGFDIGGYVVGSKEEMAVLYGKTDGIMAGRPFFERVFTLLGCKVEILRLMWLTPLGLQAPKFLTRKTADCSIGHMK